MTDIDMEGLELSKVDTETLLNEVFKSPEIVKKEERKLEHEIYQTNQSIQNLKQKIEIQQLESKNLLEAYDDIDDILKERKIGTEEVTSHFTPYEVAAMLNAVAEFGLDFATLARIIPTKTPETLKRFFDQKKKLFKKHCANIKSWQYSSAGLNLFNTLNTVVIHNCAIFLFADCPKNRTIMDFFGITLLIYKNEKKQTKSVTNVS